MGKNTMSVTNGWMLKSAMLQHVRYHSFSGAAFMFRDFLFFQKYYLLILKGELKERFEAAFKSSDYEKMWDILKLAAGD